MSFTDNYLAIVNGETTAKKKKKKKQNTGHSFTDTYAELVTEKTAPVAQKKEIAPVFVNKTAPLYQPTDIAPVVTKTILTGTRKDKEEDDDGSFLDLIGKSAMSGLASFNKGLTSTADVILGKPLQALGWENNPISSMADYYSEGYEHFKGKTDTAAQKLGNGVGVNAVRGLTEGTVAAVPDAILALMTAGGSKVATTSTLATKAAYEGGNLLTKAGVTVETMMRKPQFWTSFARTYGTDYEEAKNKGADDMTAALGSMVSSLVNAGVEIGTDGLSGMQGLPEKVAKGNKGAILDWVQSSLEEGGEEVVQGVVSNLVSKVAYDRNTDVLNAEQMVKEFGMGAAVGGILGGGQIATMATANAVTDAVQQHEAKKLTENEQKVVDKETANRIAEREQDGETLTGRQKKQIRDEVIRDMERGYISTDTIEEVLGGETYKGYKNTVDYEDGLQSEFDTLNRMKQGEMTGEQVDRRNELKAQLEDVKKTSQRSQMQTKLRDEVMGMVKGDRLAESYNEQYRRGDSFTADLSKYDEKQRATVQRAIDSGVLNNTNRSHELVDLVAKIEADKGVKFDFSNNEKILESGFAVEGKAVNGFVTKDGITLNVQSAKALNRIVGHEITHVLEGTELYDTLKTAVADYAKTKGEYHRRYAALSKLYEGQDADIDAELTADLVGDYLFSDENFVKHLSANHRNIFQKFYDEIKYLCKVVTAGSKEARQLEKVKRAFDKAYKESGKKSGDTKYSVSDDGEYGDRSMFQVIDGYKARQTDSDGKGLSDEQAEYFKDSKVRDENGKLKVMYHGSQDAGFHVFDARMSDDDISLFFVDRNDVAATYSGTSETYEAKAFRTAEDANKFFEQIGKTEYEVIEKDGKYILRSDEGPVYYTVAESESLEEIYQEFCDYEGVGYGDANYKVYLNLKNPLEVDVEGRNWNNISREFSQEVYDKYQSLTEEEKEALVQLAAWEDIDIFRDEFRNAIDGPIARAYEKLVVGTNVYDIFSIASDNFSEESLREFAVKQMNTRDYAQKAKAEGYDGVIFKNIVDVGGYGNGDEGAATVAIAFESNQIKSVANQQPTGDPDIRYSLSRNEELMQNTENYNSSHLSIDLDSARQQRQEIYDFMMKNVDRLKLPEDIEGNTAIKNSSYDITEENTTVCIRSMAADALCDAVAEHLGRPLTVQETLRVSQDLMNYTDEPECVYCYVATDRRAYREFLGSYHKQMQDAIAAIKEGKLDTNTYTAEQFKRMTEEQKGNSLYWKFLNGRKPTPNMQRRFEMWKRVAKDGKMISAKDLASEKMMQIAMRDPELAAQVKDARAYAQSASWAKKRQGYQAYDGHIMKWSQRRVNDLNKHYGLRFYSFSDFSPAFVLENMQQMTDAAARGLKGLAYTKVLDFAEIFAPTGANINISVFGYDQNGTVAQDGMMGADWKGAQDLRNRYENVGITFVATNDSQIEWALNQDWIDVVIPYHLVRTGQAVAKHFGYVNYTSESGDTKGANWKKGDKKTIYPSEHNNDKQTYLNALAEANLEPRFARWVNHPNYMKLVNETRRAANATPAMQATFNVDAAKASLQNMMDRGGYFVPIGGDYANMQDIASDIADDIRKGSQHSLSEVGETFQRRSSFDIMGEDVSLQPREQDIAPVQETAEESPAVDKPVSATEMAEMFPDDVAPMQQRLDEVENEIKQIEDAVGLLSQKMMDGEITTDDYFARMEEIDQRHKALLQEREALTADDTERVNSLAYAEAPEEAEAPYYGEEEPAVVDDPFRDRDAKEVSKRNVNAYMYENPDVRPFFQMEADRMLGELANSTKGERWYNDEVYYRSNGEAGWGGTKRNTSESIEELLDVWGMSYADIEKGLNAIVQDHGAENIAAAKKIEFVLHDRLMKGYNDFYSNGRIEPNQDYLDLLYEQQITSYNEEARQSLRDADAPPDIAPVVQPNRTAPQPSDPAPIYDDGSGQQTMWEEPETDEARRSRRKDLHAGIVEDIKNVFSGRGFNFDRVLKNARNLSTFATVDNTPQRVLEKALGYKEGQILSDLTVNKVAQNETEGIKWLNSFTDRKNGVLAQLSRQYHIKPGSKESAAAQMYAEGFYVAENGDIVEYGDAELMLDFPDIRVRHNIKDLARDPRIRLIYDETLDAINESRTRNAYPAIERLDNYFLHFRAMDDTFSRLGLPFNPNDIRAKDLPTDLNGVTADLKPGQPYFASAMHRTGKRTTFDLLGGLERYLTSAKNQIYHIDDIQTLRALRNYIADTYGQANGLDGLDMLSEEEAQERIEQVYGSHLSTFAKFLNEEANVLAGKTALIDRGLEGIIGRRGITFLNNLNQQVGSNMVGYNLSSSLTNFLPVAQTFAKTNKLDFVKAFAQTVANKTGAIFGRTDGFAENSPVMIRRAGAERFYRTAWQKIGDPGYALMGAVDSISTELIARTKYNELTRRGVDPQVAHYETDKWVSRLMGDRSLGQMPQIYNSKMLGLVTKFQLEVRNQLDSQFYDTIQETKAKNEDIQNALMRNAKTAAKVASTFVQLAVVQHLFGKAFESVAGYNPAFDIIEVLLTACGYDDDEDSEDTVLDNVEQGFLALLEDLPYASTFMDGGRIPMSAALPVEELVKGKDEWGNDKSRWKTLGEIAPYYLMPGGYGQAKKTAQGLSMFSDDHPIAGSYTDSGSLRFPVEDTLKNRVQAGIFGQWASENARDYFDNARNPLKEKQIQEFIDVDIPIQQYWEYREGLNKQETLEDKFEYIAGLDLSVEQKNILINNIVDRKKDVDMSNYEDFSSYEEFDFYSKNTEKYNFLQENGVSYKEYKSSEDAKEEYDATYSWYKNNPEKVTLSKAITDNVIEYRKYTGDLYDIRADKDENGDSISGTAKAKKIDYINNLDLDYGQRLILFRTLYDGAKDRAEYDGQIVEYLNSREDLTYEERLTILRELDFEVSEDGSTVYW